MKFTPLSISNSGNLDVVVVSHEDEELHFKLNAKHGNRSWVDLSSLFNPVNALFRNLNEEEQLEMFDQYRKLHMLRIHNTGDFSDLNTDLEDILLHIHNLLPIDGIIAWGTEYGDFTIPESIGSGESIGYPAESSYSSREYLELCALSTALKLSIPLVGSFISDYKVNYPNPAVANDFKEYSIIRLYDLTGLRECAPYKKLEAQVLARVTTRDDGVRVPMGLLTEGVGEETYPLFYLANDLLRTLCLSETDVAYREKGEANNITAKLTKSLSNRQTAIDNRFSYMNTQPPIEKAGDTGGNTSIQEDVHAIQRFSPLYGRYFTTAYSNMKLHERYGIPEELFNTFFEHVERYQPTINDGKMVIIGLVLNDFADVESLTLVQRTVQSDSGEHISVMSNILAVVASYLHTLKLYNLVNYLLAVNDLRVQEADFRQNIAESAKLNQVIRDKFRAHYPTMQDGTNYGELYVKEFAQREVCSTRWIMFSPAELSDKYGINQPWFADANFKDHLMVLCIGIWEREEAKINKASII